jgi:hypothetical protein
VAAQVACVFEGLQPRRKLSPLLVPEVGVRGPAGDDQRVIGQGQLPAVRGHRRHDPARHIEILHVGEQRARIRLLPDHVAQGRRDQPLGQDSGRDLVQQWLEQVVVGPV